MKIHLTGATGYIVHRLLPILLQHDYDVVCYVSDKSRFNPESHRSFKFKVIEVNFLSKQTNAKQVIYQSGITNNAKLSKHFNFGRNIEGILRSDNYAISRQIQVPLNSLKMDKRQIKTENSDRVLQKIRSIGGPNRMHCANWLGDY
jgi:putative NADH-flavin reductase